MKPWERYQQAAQEQAGEGPWTKYAQAPAAETVNPTEGQSGLQNAVAGFGSAMVDLGLGAKQRLDDAAAFLERNLGGKGINAALGMKNAEDIQRETQAKVDEKRQLDAPLMATTGGKTGNFVGKVLPAVPAAMVPGGQTLAGSVLSGAALGVVEPTATGESVERHALEGALGSAAGYGIGKGLAKGAEKLGERTAAKAAANAGRDTVAAEAKQAGYVIPPTQTNPTLVNRTLEGFAGKLSTAQSASVKNQQVTNRLAAKSLGLEPDTPIDRALLEEIRANAGQAYEALRGAGTIVTDGEYGKALRGLTAKYQGAAADFPELAKNDIAEIVQSINKPQFSADSALDAISILRDRASKAYASGDKALGKAYRGASDAMESLIDRNLVAAGQPAQDLLKSYRLARQTIAKTYTVENALNETTGNVIARRLASDLEKGKPLSGDLLTAARAGRAFPKAVEEVKSSTPGVSPLDYYGTMGLAGLAGPLNAFTVGVARPMVRSAILSRPYQAAMGAPVYQNRLAQIMGSQPARISLQSYGAAQLPEFSE